MLFVRNDTAGTIRFVSAILFCFVVGFFGSIRMNSSLFAKEGNLPENVQYRGNCHNSKLVFEQTGKGHVAFVGGSITEMEGYRPMLCDFLRKEYPKTSFRFTAAGISSTCSTTGAFRLDRDVLSIGPVDLLFLEFAVNDDQDAHHEIPQAIRGMEGIIRRVWKTNPNADIIITFFVNEPIMNAYRKGDAAKSIKAHRLVAEYYQVSTIDLAREVTHRIDSGQLTWQEFGGVHPAPKGNRICVDMIEQLLKNDWSKVSQTDAVKPHILPAPMDSKCYEKGRLMYFESVQKDSGWQIGIPDWKTIRGNCRTRFENEVMLSATAPGSECSFTFEGTAVGAYVLAGPDAGTISCSIDNGPIRKVNLYHSYSAGLHYPRTVIFNGDLEPGQHRIVLKVDAEKDSRSTGHAVRILAFTLN